MVHTAPRENEMDAAKNLEELQRAIEALEQEAQRASASVDEQRSTLEALEAKREEAADKVALAQRAVLDLEEQLAERRFELVEAEQRVAREALDDAISRRDAAARGLGDSIAAVIGQFVELDRLREGVLTARDELVARGERVEPVPPEPEILAEQWQRLADGVRGTLDEDEEEELVEAAARSTMGRAIKDLPAHLQQVARGRRQQLIRETLGERDRRGETIASGSSDAESS